MVHAGVAWCRADKWASSSSHKVGKGTIIAPLVYVAALRVVKLKAFPILAIARARRAAYASGEMDRPSTSLHGSSTSIKDWTVPVLSGAEGRGGSR